MLDLGRPPSSSPQLASATCARCRTISRRTGSLSAYSTRSNTKSSGWGCLKGLMGLDSTQGFTFDPLFEYYRTTEIHLHRKITHVCPVPTLHPQGHHPPQPDCRTA